MTHLNSVKRNGVM